MATERAVCTRCDGGGEVTWNPSHIGDPQCVETATCPTCGGTGRMDAAGVAVEALATYLKVGKKRAAAPSAEARWAGSGSDRAVQLLVLRSQMLGRPLGDDRAEIEMGADLIEHLRSQGRNVGQAYVAMLDVADERRRDA